MDGRTAGFGEVGWLRKSSSVVVLGMGRSWCCWGAMRGGNKTGDFGARLPAEGDNTCLARGCAGPIVSDWDYQEGGSVL